MRTLSPIDRHYYTAYKPAVNPTLHYSRRFIVMAYPYLVQGMDPRKFVLVPCYAKSLPQAEGFSFFTITVTNLYYVTNIAYVLILSSV